MISASTFDEGAASTLIINGDPVAKLQARSTGSTAFDPAAYPVQSASASSITRVKWFHTWTAGNNAGLPVGSAGQFTIDLGMDATLTTSGDVTGHDVLSSLSITRTAPGGAVDALVAILLQASTDGPNVSISQTYEANVGDVLFAEYELWTLATATGFSSSYDVDAFNTGTFRMGVLTDGFYLASASGAFDIGTPGATDGTVPVPGTLALVGLGLLAMVRRRPFEKITSSKGMAGLCAAASVVLSVNAVAAPIYDVETDWP